MSGRPRFLPKSDPEMGTRWSGTVSVHCRFGGDTTDAELKVSAPQIVAEIKHSTISIPGHESEPGLNTSKDESMRGRVHVG